MPALFQYAIFFLAALLCISLVLCVRDTTEPLAKDAPAAPPADDKAAGPAQPTVAPLQRTRARVLADGLRPGEPVAPTSIPAAGPAPLARTLARDPVIFPPLPPSAAPLGLEPAGTGPDTIAAPVPRVDGPAADEPATPPTLPLALATELGSGAITRLSGPPSEAAVRTRPDTTVHEPARPGPDTALAEPALLGLAALRPAPPAPVPATLEPAAAVVQRIGLHADAGEALRPAARSGDLLAGHLAGRSGDPLVGHLSSHSGDPLADHLVTRARDERDRALDQRNDTLWDLVVHLRDYVEQLRAERYALREEARQLRVALSEATEEVRALRAAQTAANCNELTTQREEAASSEPARLGAAPSRLH